MILLLPDLVNYQTVLGSTLRLVVGHFCWEFRGYLQKTTGVKCGFYVLVGVSSQCSSFLTQSCRLGQLATLKLTICVNGCLSLC